MKLKAFIVLVLVGVLFAQAQFYPYNTNNNRVNPGQVHTKQSNWVTAGAFSDSATTPADVNRTAALFTSEDANNVVYTIDPSWNKVVFRCSSTTDSDSTVFDIFIMDGATDDATDHYNRIGTLTFTTGTQTSSTATYEFADTCVASNDQYGFNVISPTGNYIAIAEVDVKGARFIGICPTTVTNAAILEIRGY